MTAVKQQLESLNITLPNPPTPAANYVPYTVTGNQVVISGQIPFDMDGSCEAQKGKLGDDCSIEKGQEVARICGLNILAQLQKACDGDLSRVKKCVRLGVFVNGTPDFTDHPKVANGVSDLMVDVFGKDIGSHARFAVGVSGLPFGVAVEADAVFEIA